MQTTKVITYNKKITLCDFCNKDVTENSHNFCSACGKDVCYKCSQSDGKEDGYILCIECLKTHSFRYQRDSDYGYYAMVHKKTKKHAVPQDFWRRRSIEYLE